MWHVISQKNGTSALGLPRASGLGSYKTAWAPLHTVRRAMVRLGWNRLHGTVEVHENYWGGEEARVTGRLAQDEALLLVAAEVAGQGIGRIQLRRAPDLTKSTLRGFPRHAIEPRSILRTDGLPAYLGLAGYGFDG